MLRPIEFTLVLLFSLLLSSCASVQYSALEKVGVYKRDILVDRVEDAREAQQDAKEQVVSAYEQFTSLVNVDGGELEQTYKKLDKTVRKTEGQVEEIDDRIAAIERVADDLFEEWQKELDQYSSQTLRQSSARKLDATKTRYGTMLDSMKRARERIDPVLRTFQDQVLFLKHNLNARALDALKSEVGSIETKVAGLIAEMETAIAEADQFVASME